MEKEQRDNIPSSEDWTKKIQNVMTLYVHINCNQQNFGRKEIFILYSLVNIQPCILKKVLGIKV